MAFVQELLSQPVRVTLLGEWLLWSSPWAPQGPAGAHSGLAWKAEESLIGW